MQRVIVELVEDDDSPSPAVPDAPAPGVVRWLRGHPRVLGAALAALLLTVGTTVVTERVRAAQLHARYAAAADVPGTVRPVEPPLDTVLDLDDETAGDLQGGVLVGDTVVGTGYGAGVDESTVRVRAISTSTGDVVWSTVLDAPALPETLPEGVTRTVGGWTNTWCVAVGGGPARLACVAGRSAGEIREDLDDGSVIQDVVATQAYLLLDGRDGTVLARRDEPLGATVRVGEDAYWVMQPEPDGAGVSIVERALDTTTRWERHVEMPDVPLGPASALASSDDVITLVHGGQATVLDDDGTELGTFGPGTGQLTGLYVRGSAVVVSWSTSATRAGDGLWLWTPDGGAMELSGESPLYLGIDDGTLPDVVLTRSGGRADSGTLVARDGSDGTVLWRSSARSDGSALLVDGRLVTQTSGVTSAVDPRTGRVLWKATVGDEVQTFPLTDGVHLLVPTRRTLVALDLRTGHQDWTAHLAEAPGDTLRLVPGPEPTPSEAPDVVSSDPFADGWWTRTTDRRLAFTPGASGRLLVLG